MLEINFFAALAVSRVRDEVPEQTELPTIRGQLHDWWVLFRANPRLRWASLAMVFLHGHVATSPFVQLWLLEDKGMTQTGVNRLYGTMFIVFGLIGSIGAGLLADWAQRRFGMDRARSSLIMLVLLVPLIIGYRLGAAGSWLFTLGMAASILFMTMIYGPLFSVIERELPAHLKGTGAGINILALNILMIGGLAYGIGLSSQMLADSGATASWTYPLLAADVVAFSGLLMVWKAIRAGALNPNS